MKREPATMPPADGMAADWSPVPAGLASLYRRWRLPLVRLLQGRLGSRADAEDLAQQVFVRMAATGRMPLAGKEQAYLARSATHADIDAWRRRGGTQALELVSAQDCGDALQSLPADAASDPLDTAHHRQQLARLDAALAELPARQREAFTLHAVEGLTQEDVAQRMGISLRMVSRHIGRAQAHCALRLRHGPVVPTSKPSTRRTTLARGAVLGLLGCLALGGGWHAWNGAPPQRLHFATGPHETREVTLPDGSQVALNIGSRLEVRYEPRRRVLTLAQGEAFFRVAPDPQRPFSVDAGHSRVTVVGTAFNLRAAPATLVLQVQQGQVELRPDLRAAQGPVLRLGPGAGIAVDIATGRHQAVPAPVETVGDWRSGHLRLQRMPLGEVAQELARYLGRPVRLASPELAQLPVSGYLATAAPEGFLELLPDLVPVRVHREAGGWTITQR